MAIERPPKGSPHPLPIGYRPFGGTPYRVQDGDTWKKLAFRWFINVEDLILFNFLTLNPDEVNWYLRRNVGCKKQTLDRLNYEFSSSDKPGIISFPPSKPLVARDSIEEFSERMGSGTDLGKALTDADNSGSIYDYVGFSLNISDFILTGLAMSAVELGALGLGLDFLGAATALVAVGLALGSPHLDAVNSIKRGNMLSGLSRGIVLGAARETNTFVQDNFVRGSESYDINYPLERKNFQAAYLFGLVKGLELGRRLTKRERHLFFKHLESLAGYHPPGNFYMNLQSKSAAARKSYYIDCAAKFRKESTK